MASEQALKRKIARQFSRAAPDYNGAAEVQLPIAEQLLSQLPSGLNSLLDIGAGTGRITARLTAHGQQVFGLDIAEGMMRVARQSHGSGVHWLVGDAEALPIADKRLDAVYSSMALQWCAPMALVFNEIYRVLRPGGSAHLAILCDGALDELRQSWAQLDNRPHVNRYPTAGELAATATDAGFAVNQHQQDFITRHADIYGLLQSLKKIGANVVTEGPRTPLKRQSLSRLARHYHTHFASADGALPLTYRVSFLQLSKPHLRTVL